jgi:hypothetical protein
MNFGGLGLVWIPSSTGLRDMYSIEAQREFQFPSFLTTVSSTTNTIAHVLNVSVAPRIQDITSVRKSGRHAWNRAAANTLTEGLLRPKGLSVVMRVVERAKGSHCSVGSRLSQKK